MSRKRTPGATGLEAPNIPEGLITLPDPGMLTNDLIFEGVLLADADLSGAEAEDIVFEQMIGRRVRLTQATLPRFHATDAQFDRCDFAGATMADTVWRRVALVSSRLLGAVLLDARLDDVLVQGGTGEALRIWNSRLRSVRFERCNLRGASFHGSTLDGVIFRDCDLSGAEFLGCSLRGADLRGSTLSAIQAELRDLQGVIVSPVQAIEITALLGLEVQPDGVDS